MVSLLGTGRNLATLLPTVRQKVENVPSELGTLAKEISKQSVEEVTWYLLATCKIWKREINQSKDC